MIAMVSGNYKKESRKESKRLLVNVNLTITLNEPTLSISVGMLSKNLKSKAKNKNVPVDTTYMPSKDSNQTKKEIAHPYSLYAPNIQADVANIDVAKI